MINVLKEAWRLDCNPAKYRMKNGKKIKYAKPEGPSEIIATPVFYKNRISFNISLSLKTGNGLEVSLTPFNVGRFFTRLLFL